MIILGSADDKSRAVCLEAHLHDLIGELGVPEDLVAISAKEVTPTPFKVPYHLRETFETLASLCQEDPGLEHSLRYLADLARENPDLQLVPEDASEAKQTT